MEETEIQTAIDNEGVESIGIEDIPAMADSQRESTEEDYWNVYNPSGIATNNPQLMFKASTDTYGDFDFDSEEFQTVYKVADIETKRAMLNANNTSDALRIAERRKVFVDSQNAINEDGLLTQVGMGIVPSIATISSLLPVGVVFKTAQVGNRASRIVRMSAAGAGAGIAANVLDEALFDMQGMPTHYTGAVLAGATFGGALGLLGGLLSGPSKTTVANALVNENDTFSKHYNTDPEVEITLDADGTIKIQDVGKMKKSLVDRLPWIGGRLRSDVHTVYQDDSPVLRGFMARISAATQSLKDSAGNVLPIRKAGVDHKRETLGIHSNLTKEIQDVFGETKQAGYKGNEEEFSTDVWNVYMEAMNKQNNEAVLHANKVVLDNQGVVAEKKRAFKEDADIRVREAEEPEIFYRDADGKHQPMTEELMGTIPDEKLIFKKNKKKAQEVKDQIAIEKEALLDDIKGEHNRARDEYFTNNPGEFKGETSLVKGAGAYRKYFQEMLNRSQEVGIKELKGININRLYAPRTYNYRGIKTGKVSQDVVHNEIRAGLANDARNQGMSKEALDEATAIIVNMLNSSAFDLNNLSTSYLVKNLPFETHLKQKKLYLNEQYMPNILNNNMDNVIGAYHYKMSGRQATQFAFGTDNLDEIMQLVKDEHLAKGILHNPESIEAFSRTIKDLVGDLRMNQLADTASWTFTRNLTSFNSNRMGGGFGGNQFIELASSVMMLGVQSMFTGRLLKSLQNSADLLFTHKGQHDEFSKYLIDSGYMSDTLHTSRINRYSDTEAGFNSGWLENKLNWMNDKLMKYNGMRYFMGVMEDYTGSAIVTQLKQGGVDANRLARWGLSDNDAASLGAKLKEVTKGDKWDLDLLSTKEQDSLQLAITRGIDEIVVQGDSIHLPAWMKAPGQFTKVLTQFMRFPLIAQETLLRKGMKEEQAQLVSGIIGSIGAYIGLKYLREQAGLAAGTIHPADAKYDYSNYNDDDWLRVTGEALNYTAPLGFMTSVWNYGAIATGQPELGREWQSKNGMSSLLGPSGGLGEDMIQLMRAAVEGNMSDERTLNRVKGLTPFMNLPLINEGGKYMIEKYGD